MIPETRAAREHSRLVRWSLASATGAQGHRHRTYCGDQSARSRLVRVLSERNVDYVLDVGAHTGEFARLIRDQCGWEGPICSFEPVHSSFVQLERAMKHDPKWHGHAIALGSASATATMRHFPARSDLDTLLPSNEYRRYRYGLLFAPSDALLLKTDTQGFDLEVVRGASNCLDRIVSIQIELPSIAIYENLPPLGIAIDEIMELGFYPVGFFPISRDRGLRVVEFDGLFVRAT